MSTLSDLVEAVGGNTAVGEAIESFYRRVFEDENLRPFFESTNMAHLRARQSMFLSMLLGGRAIYTGREINVVHARARMQGLTDQHFDAYLKHFRAALNEVGVQPDKVEKIMTSLDMHRDFVLTSSKASKAMAA